jgi:hypothetical protein
VQELLAEIGGAREALVYRWLYWPDVFEFQGAVFVNLSGVSLEDMEKRYAAAWRAGNRMNWTTSVESFNYFEIAHLFRMWSGPEGADHELQRLLARCAVEPWQAKLHLLFPQRKFEVGVAEADEDLGIRITVRQVAPKLVPPPGWASHVS